MTPLGSVLPVGHNCARAVAPIQLSRLALWAPKPWPPINCEPGYKPVGRFPAALPFGRRQIWEFATSTISSGPTAICGLAIRLEFGLLGLLMLLKKSAVLGPSNSMRGVALVTSGLPAVEYDAGILAGGLDCAASPAARPKTSDGSVIFPLLHFIHFLLIVA